MEEREPKNSSAPFGPRFSVGTLMIVVTGIGVAMTAFRISDSLPFRIRLGIAMFLLSPFFCGWSLICWWRDSAAGEWTSAASFFMVLIAFILLFFPVVN